MSFEMNAKAVWLLLLFISIVWTNQSMNGWITDGANNSMNWIENNNKQDEARPNDSGENSNRK